MKKKYSLAFVIAVGLIFSSVSAASPSVMTQNQAYGLTDTTNPEDLANISEDESSDGLQDNQTQNETQVQELSGGGKDKNGPTIVSRSPNVGTVQIPVSSDIKVTFSEPIKKSSISTSTFMLKSTIDGNDVLGTVSLDTDGTTATFNPTSDLANVKSYSVTLTSGIKDLAGNRLNSENWSFTTEAGGSSGSGSGSKTGASGLDIKTAPGGELGVLKEAAQYEEDSKLLDRLLPILYKKIDINTIIAKADGKKLLEKVLPYLDVKLVVREQEGPIKKVGVEGLYNIEASVYTECSQNEVAVSGGYQLTESKYNAAKYDNIPIIGHRYANGWIVQAGFNDDGNLQGFAQCATLEVGIKDTAGQSTSTRSQEIGSDLGIKTKPGSDVIKEPVP